MRSDTTTPISFVTMLGCENELADCEPPIADFMEPVEYAWTEEGFEAHQAIKKYCEETLAD